MSKTALHLSRVLGYGTAAMISMQGVRFEYSEGGFALDVPELDVRAGAKAAAIGPSGSGKTTLLNLISGIERPGRGSIHTAGTRVDRLSAAERRSFRITTVGFVFQQFLLLEYLDVLDNIVYPYRLHPELILDDTVRTRAKSLASELGLGELLRRLPGELSQGERQRVAIARALVTMPKLVLADEPTGNLDPRAKRRALDLLFEQCGARGATLLMVTHDHALLDRFERVVDVGVFGAEAPAA